MGVFMPRFRIVQNMGTMMSHPYLHVLSSSAPDSPTQEVRSDAQKALHPLEGGTAGNGEITMVVVDGRPCQPIDRFVNGR